MGLIRDLSPSAAIARLSCLLRRNPTVSSRKPCFSEIVRTTSRYRSWRIIRMTEGAYEGYPADVQQAAVTAAEEALPSGKTAVVDAIERTLGEWERNQTAWDRYMCSTGRIV